MDLLLGMFYVNNLMNSYGFLHSYLLQIMLHSVVGMLISQILFILKVYGMFT